MKRFVIGDIHGRLEALKEVLYRCQFDYDNDKLIILGDIVDGGYNTNLVVEELLKIKNKVLVLGNHDLWFMDHIRSGWSGDIWLNQGGKNTLESYKDGLIPMTHQEFFNSGRYYYVEDEMCFVHGGFDPKVGPEGTSQHDLVWDRELIYHAKQYPIPGFKLIFVGHTTTELFNEKEPVRFNNLIMMDCGAGWRGKLAIMDIDSMDYWTSDKLTNV